MFVFLLLYSSVIDKKNIVITGGTGSFGKQLVYELMSYNTKKVIVFSRDEDKQHSMRKEFEDQKISKKLEYCIGDVRDYDRLQTVTKNADIIFHAAALKQVPYIESHPFEAVKTNIHGSYNVIKAAVANNVKNVIAISTDKAVKPVNAMGMTKALQEKIFLADDLSKNNTIFSCVRYGNVMGSRGSVMPLFDAKIEKGEPLPITHPNMTRFMLTLKDAIDLVFYSLKHGRGGEIFVKKAPSVKILDFAKSYAKIKTGKNNYPVKFVGIRPGEKLNEILVSSEEMINTTEKKDHFIIKKSTKFNNPKTLKLKSELIEYSSSNVKLLSHSEIEKLLRQTNWIS